MDPTRPALRSTATRPRWPACVVVPLDAGLSGARRTFRDALHAADVAPRALANYLRVPAAPR